MIPALSLMVGMYIITRMIHVILDKEKVSIVTTIRAAVTILVAIFCIYTILEAGGEAARLLQ